MAPRLREVDRHGPRGPGRDVARRPARRRHRRHQLLQPRIQRPAQADGAVATRTRCTSRIGGMPCWPRAITREEIQDELMEKFKEFPGVNFNFSQLIRDNVEEALSGVKGANSVKLFGNDLETLEEAGQRVVNILQTVRGIENVGLFHIIGQPNLEIQIDRDGCARYGDQRRRRRGGRPGGHRRPGVLADGRGGEALRHRPPAAARPARRPRRDRPDPGRRPRAPTASRGPDSPGAARQDHPAQPGRVVHLSREQPPVHPDQVQRPRPRPRLGHRRGPAQGRGPQARARAARRATGSSGRASSPRCRRPTAA